MSKSIDWEGVQGTINLLDLRSARLLERHSYFSPDKSRVVSQPVLQSIHDIFPTKLSRSPSVLRLLKIVHNR